MALPTQKHTKSRKRKRLATLRLKRRRLAKCPQCKKAIPAHQACPFCGTYANKQVIKIKSKIDKKKAEKKE
ncbi:50S ribosomal protein L32 [Patescibacteria group bacterium]|nr:50S ribosomal protein L32 [Patescibacteria group bacterium]MBU4512409.1 50S ribosomal protein L32 [Patescibacteria group bacterium]MCG2693183.1 50S ribosomal protein L32 [Candidatus Parcubacteria bacterium]